MTKLLYITNGINGSAGLERVLSVKASYLADHGYDVHLAVLNQGAVAPFYHFSSKITIHSVAVEGNAMHYTKSYISGMRRLVKSVQPDLISVCDDGLKAFFLPLILKKPCPMIYERHVSQIIALGPNPSPKTKLKFAVQKQLMTVLGRTFDTFVLLTEDNRAEWRLPNLKVIANPLPFFPNRTSRVDSKTVIAVGKQSYQKGFDRLLHAWKHVAAAFPDWKLHIYGKPDPAQKLDALAESLAVAESVSFFPAVSNIDEKFLESAIFAFSSRFEGFGMVLIEAMACGVPCVSFDCPCGPSEIVKHGETGYLVENGNIEKFAKALMQLMESDARREAFGEAARNEAEKYLPERIAEKWQRLFEELLAR